MAYYEPNVDPLLQAEENKKVNLALTPLQRPYLSGLKLNADISIGNLTLNTIDANNVVWVVTDLEGWWSHPEPDVPDLARGWGDGSYDSKGRYEAREITLEGSFFAPDPSLVAAARNQLIEATDLVYEGGWLIVDENPSKSAFVRLSGRPEIVSASARGRVDFSIGLRAADPIKYEWVSGSTDGYEYVDISSGDSDVLENTGNTKVPAVFEITGGLTSNTSSTAVIQNLSRLERIDIIDSVQATDTLEIDTYNREVLLVSNTTATITNVSGDGTFITYTANNSFTEGQTVVISGVDPSGYNTSSEGVTLYSANSTAFVTLGNVTASYVSGGTASVASVSSSRGKVKTLIDWIYLDPGLNTITFEDTSNPSSNAICRVYFRSGWIG